VIAQTLLLALRVYLKTRSAFVDVRSNFLVRNGVLFACIITASPSGSNLFALSNCSGLHNASWNSTMMLLVVDVGEQSRHIRRVCREIRVSYPIIETFALGEITTISGDSVAVLLARSSI
jgi:hypothetical protein